MMPGGPGSVEGVGRKRNGTMRGAPEIEAERAPAAIRSVRSHVVQDSGQCSSEEKGGF